jgi:ABC-type xylose transport system permease subunit
VKKQGQYHIRNEKRFSVNMTLQSTIALLASYMMCFIMYVCIDIQTVGNLSNMLGVINNRENQHWEAEGPGDFVL